MKALIIEKTLYQMNLAIMDDGKLETLLVEGAGTERLLSNIYKGRVINVIPGINAAFVDVGLPKNAFLHAREAFDQATMDAFYERGETPKIQDAVKKGQEILVQVIKEPINDKGAQISTRLTFPSKSLVLLHEQASVGYSRRINQKDQLDRLADFAQGHLPKEHGVIFRTESQFQSNESLAHTLEGLLKRQDEILKYKVLGNAPKCVYQDANLIEQTLRDYYTEDVDVLYIRHLELYNEFIEVQKIIDPGRIEGIQLIDPGVDLFSHFGVAEKIRQTLNTEVSLSNGGSIVIDETEAMTIIDVNSSHYVGGKDQEDTIYQTNMAAALQIPKELMLRNIGGIIIIDFIDMRDKRLMEEVVHALRLALRKDRVKTNLVGLSHLGLVEITRRKQRNKLSVLMEETCPYCQGKGRVLHDNVVLHDMTMFLERTIAHSSASHYVINVSRYLYNRCMKEKESIESAHGITCHFVLDYSLDPKTFKLKHMGNEKSFKDFLNGIDE